MCVRALEQLGGRGEKNIPLKDIVSKILELWPTENVDEQTIRCQVFRHCINAIRLMMNSPIRGKCGNKEDCLSQIGKATIDFIIRKQMRMSIFRQLRKTNLGDVKLSCTIA